MEKILINVIWLLVSSGALTYLINLLQKWLTARIHNKNEQLGIVLTANFAKGLVAEYANSSSVPVFQRKDAVVHDLAVALDKKGHPKIADNIPYLESQVEKVYQEYKANGGDVHSAKKTSAPINPAPVATTNKTYTQAEVDEMLKKAGNK